MVFRVLVYTRTTGYRHDSIPAAVGAVRALGHAHGFEADATEDPEVFEAPSTRTRPSSSCRRAARC